MGTAWVVHFSRLVVGATAVVVASGVLWMLGQYDPIPSSAWWGAANLTFLLLVYGFHVRPGADRAPRRPWRDPGRAVLWAIGLVCVLTASSLWLSSLVR